MGGPLPRPPGIESGESMNRLRRTKGTGSQSAFFQITVFSFSNYLSELFFFLRGLFLARILGPEIFGVWAQMKLALNGCRHSSLGANDAMVREVPYLKGQNRLATAEQIKAAAAGINLVLSTTAALLIALLVFLLRHQLSPGMLTAWLILVVIFPLRQMLWYTRARLRAEKRFDRLSLVMLSLAVLTTVCGVASGFFFGLIGFLVALGASHLLVLGVVLKTACPLRLQSFRLGLSLRLIRTGFPIMASRFLLYFLYNVDQILIWLLLSQADLGLYSIQANIITIVLLVPTVVSAVLYPRIMEAFGESDNPRKLAPYLIQPTLMMGWMACLLLGLIFILLHLPVKWLLPAYVASITPGRVLLLASFFRVIANMSMISLISLRQEQRLMRISLAAITVCAIVDGLMIAKGYGLAGVAVGTVIGFGFYAYVAIASAARLVGLTARRAALFMALTLAPFLLMSTLLGTIYGLIPEQGALDRMALTNTLLRCGLFGLPMALLCATIFGYRRQLAATFTRR